MKRFNNKNNYYYNKNNFNKRNNYKIKNSNNFQLLKSSSAPVNDELTEIENNKKNNEINNEKNNEKDNIEYKLDENIILNDELNDDLINELINQGNKNNIPNVIQKFNNNHINPLMISSSINSLVNFKTKNFRNIDELHSSPNLSKLFVEYKKDFKSRLNAWMNKLSLTQPMNFDLIIKFINDSFYNENYIKQMIFYKIFNDINTTDIIKENIIETYCILLDKLKQNKKYSYNFIFDNEFLNKYGNNDDVHNAFRFNSFINNIAILINHLEIHNLITEDEMFIFLNATLLNPSYDNLDIICFCKRILNIIHGTNNDYYLNHGLYVASKKYLKDNFKIIEIFNDISNELFKDDKKPFIYKMVFEIIENLVNGKQCCNLCNNEYVNKTIYENKSLDFIEELSDNDVFDDDDGYSEDEDDILDRDESAL